MNKVSRKREKGKERKRVEHSLGTRMSGPRPRKTLVVTRAASCTEKEPLVLRIASNGPSLLMPKVAGLRQSKSALQAILRGGESKRQSGKRECIPGKQIDLAADAPPKGAYNADGHKEDDDSAKNRGTILRRAARRTWVIPCGEAQMAR